MLKALRAGLAWLTLMFGAFAHAQEQVVDIPTRDGVTQRFLVVSPAAPRGAVVLLAGGHGGLQIAPDGSLAWGQGNFLVRSRQAFADRGLLVAVVDAPSDRQRAPYLTGFRQTPEHAADIKAVIAWLRAHGKGPVWLVGTSRGTQSAAYLATTLTAAEGPDGLVLTSTILNDSKMRAVPALPLERLRIPVLVVHHEQDGCKLCPFSEVAPMMAQLKGSPAPQLLAIRGGQSRGDPCEAFAYHGFNGVESAVVDAIAAAMLRPDAASSAASR